jgi:ATPase family associated with various cellular activities (AAA)
VTIDPEALANAIAGLHRWAEQNAPRPESALRRQVAEHLGGDPGRMPIVTEALGSYERPNLQVALEAWLEGAGRAAETLGLGGQHGWRPGLGDLVSTGPFPTVEPGPVEYVTVDVGARRIRCVRSALFLLTDGGDRLAATLTIDDRGMGERLQLQLMAPGVTTAEAVLVELRALMVERNVYRGRVLELERGEDGQVSVKVRTLSPVARDRIVLPAGVLERVERHTLGFARHAETLRAAGRHLKRGLLLHGPPGTGKTLTAMHLSSRMPDRTVLLLTGVALYSLADACRMARTLAPAMVVLEDVDLVAEDRDFYEGSQPILFELLNEMDGLAEDADVVFVLTTNRLEVLEQALAARPGRIDEAVELPLPDADGRRRLLALFSEGLDVRAGDMVRVVEDTAGMSPAFIRELVRRAALLAADEDAGELVVAERHLATALDELQRSTEQVTRGLLGSDEMWG